MFVSRVATRSSRVALTQCCSSLLLNARQKQPQFPILCNQYHSLHDSQNKVASGHVSLLNHLNLNGSAFQWFGISSSASLQPNEKDATQPGSEQGSASEGATTSSGETEVSEQTEASVSGETRDPDKKDTLGSNMKPNSKTSGKGRRRTTKWLPFSNSDSDLESEPSRDDLVRLVSEKEEQLKSKHEEIQKMQDKALRTYAEMQNSMDRTKREAQNLKKFAIQDFAKRLLDVADNLGRASSVVKDSFVKIDASEDTAGAVPLLKTLLEGVEMTEKQLAEVFKKFGVQKYNPLHEEFDPHRHMAVFQVPDPSKPPGTVAVVLKAGYMLYDRVIRPAEVGVTQETDKEVEQGSEA